MNLVSKILQKIVLDRTGDPADHSGILMTGLHHAREAITVTMEIYSFANFIYKYYHNCTKTREILTNNIIWYIYIFFCLDRLDINRYYILFFKKKILCKVCAHSEHRFLRGELPVFSEA